jgi:hypothetical protein
MQYIATGTQGEYLAYSGTPALGNLVASISGFAGTDTPGNLFPAGTMTQALVLPNQATDPPAVSGASEFFSSVAGRPIYLSQTGVRAVIERSSVNTAHFVATTVTPTWSDFSATMNYAAGEGATSSEFEIEVIALGSWASSQQGFNLSFFVDGASLGGTIGQQTVGITGSAASAPFLLRATYILALDTFGASGTALLASHGTIAMQTNTNRTQADSMVLGTLTDAITFDSTVNHTFKLVFNWAAAGSGQTITTYRTKLTRRN